MRGAGKSFAFRCNPYDYRSAASSRDGSRVSPPLATVVRDRTVQGKKKDPHGKGGEGWRWYGTYEYVGTVVPTAEEFRKLSKGKKRVVVDRFVQDLLIIYQNLVSWYYEVMFDGVYLDEEKTTPIWSTRIRKTTKSTKPDPLLDHFDPWTKAIAEKQRAAIVKALETTGLNIAYNMFRYLGPIEGEEVDDSVRHREMGRRMGHKTAREVWTGKVRLFLFSPLSPSRLVLIRQALAGRRTGRRRRRRGRRRR